MQTNSFRSRYVGRFAWTVLAAVVTFCTLSGSALAEPGSRLTMGMRDASLNEVMEMLARQHRVNILLADDVDAQVSFNLYDVNLDEAVRSIASAAGYMVEKRSKTYFILPEDQAGKTPGSGFTIVRAMPVRYSDAAELESKLGDYLSDFGTITAIPEQRMLMVEDQPGYVYRIENLLQQLDRRPKQVLIEARLLEIQLNDEESFGIDWATFFSVGNGDAGGGLQGVGTPGTSGSSGFFFDLLDSDYELAIRALERDGRVRNLASPKVVTLENMEAEVIIGDRQGYAVTTTINQVTSETIEFLESGVILRVTPTIDESGQIMLSIHPEVSNGIVDDNGLPSQTTTELTTQLLVPSGRAIFIGGLMRHSMTEAEAGIPILGKIPGLRWAFGSRTRSSQNTETVVVITPRLLDDTFDLLNDQAIRDIEAVEEDMRGNSAVIEGYVDEAFPMLPTRQPTARDGASFLDTVNGPVTTSTELAGPPASLAVSVPVESPASDSQANSPGDSLSAPAVELAVAGVATKPAAPEVAQLADVATPEAMPASTLDEPAAKVPTAVDFLPEANTGEPAAIQPAAVSPVVQSKAAESADAEPPAGRFALNLHSDLVPVEDLPAPGPGNDERLIYITQTELDGETWYRLRLGFFMTEAEAQAALDEWLDDYPSAWLVRVGPRERAQAAAPRAVALASP